MHRYSEHAPGDLAEQCVDSETGDDTVTSSSGASSSGASSSGDSSSGDSSSGDSSSGSEGPAVCVDLDGDGWGDGEECLGPDCDDDNPNAADDCIYIGPQGSDDNDGDVRDAPVLTFERAISLLAPGRSLVVLDGTYSPQTSGTLEVECTALNNGTAASPVFVRAENDRQAVIERGGSANGIALRDCSYWRVRGLTVVGEDLWAESGGIKRHGVQILESDQIELRQLFVIHSNRYHDESTLLVETSEDVLVEDTEVHDFHRYGFFALNSERVTFRRCYGDSHGAADLQTCTKGVPDGCDGGAEGTNSCPYCSREGGESTGDSTFNVVRVNDLRCENCVSRGSFAGFEISAPGGAAARNEVIQSLSIADDRGAEITGNPSLEDFVLQDFVSIRPVEAGVVVRYPDAITLRNVTVLESLARGVYVRLDADACVSPGCPFTIDRVLAIGSAGEGILVTENEAAEWTLTSSNVVGSDPDLGDYVYPGLPADAFDDMAGKAQNNSAVPVEGVGFVGEECQVYVPGDEAFGANVTDIVIDGVPTSTPLWGPDGSFPCGPVPPAGLVDPDWELCSQLGADLRLGAGQCPVPPASG